MSDLLSKLEIATNEQGREGKRQLSESPPHPTSLLGPQILFLSTEYFRQHFNRFVLIRVQRNRIFRFALQAGLTQACFCAKIYALIHIPVMLVLHCSLEISLTPL